MTVANGSTARTGHGGKVTCGFIGGTEYLLARVTQWSVNPTISTAAWADSDSAGYTNRTPGRRDCTGSMSGKLDRSSPAYDTLLFNTATDPWDSDMVEVALWEDGNVANPNEYWYFPRAVITNFNITYDMDTRDPVEWSADFEADGRFYMPGEPFDATYTNRTLSTYAFKTFTESA